MLRLNTESLYSVLRDFHTLTKIRIVIFDAAFRELLAYPTDREQFCTQLRRTSEGNAACEKSDMQGCRTCAKTKEAVIYRCHAGLTEAVVPIRDSHNVLAYVMFGQILTRETCESTKADLKARFPELAEAAEALPIRSAEELGAAATVLQAIGSFMMSNRWVTPMGSDLIRQLDHYIDDHIDQSIRAKDICAAFRMGRTRLYGLCADHLGCGLAEYVRKRRIQYAEKLLIETKLPITEIAYRTGFSDHNPFGRVFRSIVGCSARQYRNEQHERDA